LRSTIRNEKGEHVNIGKAIRTIKVEPIQNPIARLTKRGSRRKATASPPPVTTSRQ
jgi:ribosomal 50S subunit-associated protein YjgA (DUF615 family)